MVHGFRRDVETNHFTPREYQIELLEIATKRNTIVQLGTGSGKTLIAILLIKEYGTQVFTSIANGGKRIFFLVQNVSLVQQQAEQISIHTSMNVGSLHGGNTDTTTNIAKWNQYLDENHVIVITAQVFLDLVDHAFYDLTNLALLVFDECHHSMGSKHPYRLIMDRVRKLENDRPRILGLTASLINNKTSPQNLEKNIVKLETILDSTVAMASDLNATSKYGAKPVEHLVNCKNFSTDIGISKAICTILERLLIFCQNYNGFHVDFDVDPRKYVKETIRRALSVLKQCGQWCAWKVVQFLVKELTKQMKLPHIPEKTQEFLRLAESSLHTTRRLLEPKLKSIKQTNELKEFLTPKLNRLLKILSTYNPETTTEQPLCGIVFVEQRMVAYALKTLLKHLVRFDQKTFGFLKVDFIVGYSSFSIDQTESQALQKRQIECLRKFHRGELNLIIATNVLEEGVDVQQCNLVVKFDRSQDYRSYVQSRGRARKPGSMYFILCEENQIGECVQDLKDFHTIERFLLTRYCSVHNPTAQEELLTDVDDIEPPYIVQSTGAKVALSGAIALLNRYCASLPSDIFTRLVPENRLIPDNIDTPTGYKAEIYLPINSPIKETICLQSFYKSKKIARMVIALKACETLHQKGELNDHLLPQGKDTVAKLMSQLDDDPDECIPGLAARVGSSKRKQLYDKSVAKVLNRALPKKNVDTYIYVLEMELVKAPSLESNPKGRKFQDPQQTAYCFGFLSSIILPPIPPFPAYLRQGDMRVYVRRAPNTVRLNDHTLQMLIQFHDYVFKNVLLLNKDNLQFSLSEDSALNTLIVPLKRIPQANGQIDYEISMRYVTDLVQCKGELPRVPDPEERKNYKFRKEDYLDAVVMPWYRSMEQPTFYYVAEILENMNPNSSFPDNAFTSFNEYFEKKYNINIYDQEQALLDVDYTSNRLNLLLPRPRSSKRVTKPSDLVQRQILVPELMDRHPIAAHLWNTICSLPCLFYRINQLLLADELREKICREALGYSETVPEDFHWNPLSYPSTYEEKQSLIVAKIQQLRKENKTFDGSTEIPTSTDRQGFEIGVWDPELACGLQWRETDLVDGGTSISQAINSDADMERDPDTFGLVKPYTVSSGDLSDDEENDAIIFFDSRKFSSKVDDNSPDFANPRQEVVASLGNGDWDNWNSEAQSTNNLPFEILPSDSNFDLQALNAEIQKLVMNEPNLSSGSGAETKNVGQRSSSSKAVAEKRNQASLQFHDRNEKEDHETRRKQEESVNLLDFDDGIEGDLQDVPNHREFKWEEELETLLLGEKEKSEKDERILKEIAPDFSISFEKPCVNAPETNSAFTFTSASPSISGTSIVSSSSKSLIDFDTVSSASQTHIAGRPWPQPAQYDGRYGVSPCLLLQALTTSNANDGINLERLETIGDSFLKYAVTDYLYHQHIDQHEGKLSFARSKEVSNCNLYRLGRRLDLPSLIVGYKFDVQDAWLPPCYMPNSDFKAPNSETAAEEDRLMESVLAGVTDGDTKNVKSKTGWDDANSSITTVVDGVEVTNFPKINAANEALINELAPLPYNMLTQQMISDKSIADSVEALIGAHLLSLGPEKTLKVMNWLGIKVLTEKPKPSSPLLRIIDTDKKPHLSRDHLKEFWVSFQLNRIEDTIGYQFKEKAYLLQAFTHVSFFRNRITGCYQRLEFLGDAVLDYMITRFLYEHEKQYSPGVLTDLRSALVNNTIFASLAVKYGFHKHFVAICPGLHQMIEKFVKLCREKNFFDANFNAEMYMVTTEEEYDEGQEEDIEVPKAMSDIFESLAGAVYLDSDRNLDIVWRVFYGLMKNTIDECCRNPPRSPIRELLELEPGHTRFSKMERIIETGKARVTVEVNKAGQPIRFTGMARNYRIAKATAAKRALKYLKSLEEQKLRSKKPA